MRLHYTAKHSHTARSYTPGQLGQVLKRYPGMKKKSKRVARCGWVRRYGCYGDKHPPDAKRAFKEPRFCQIWTCARSTCGPKKAEEAIAECKKRVARVRNRLPKAVPFFVEFRRRVEAGEPTPERIEQFRKFVEGQLRSTARRLRYEKQDYGAVLFDGGDWRDGHFQLAIRAFILADPTFVGELYESWKRAASVEDSLATRQTSIEQGLADVFAWVEYSVQQAAIIEMLYHSKRRFRALGGLYDAAHKQEQQYTPDDADEETEADTCEQDLCRYDGRRCPYCKDELIPFIGLVPPEDAQDWEDLHDEPARASPLAA